MDVLLEGNWKLGSEDQLVRVNGIFGMISSSMMPIGMLVFGPIADVVKIEWLLIISGSLMLLVGCIFAFTSSFIQADHPLKKESEATKQFDIG